MKILYTAHATITAGRDGRAETDDKQLSVVLSRPGSNKLGTNPEQLFAAGYGACFGSALAAVAKQRQGEEIGEIAVQADVNLNQDEQGGFFLSVTLNVTIAGVDDTAAEAIVKAAHKMCPYSKAIRGNVNVVLNVNGTNLSHEHF
jgi:osmotically inducible protein OsmC